LKYLFVLTLLAIVAALLYWRLRPYILAARRIFGAVREAQRVSSRMDAAPPADLPRRDRRQPAPGEKLVRCAACGTWMPAARAVTLRATGVSYCSHACLERAADAPSRTRKSASSRSSQ
jgi:hypothetical protein